MIVGIILVIVFLSILILVHEFGHFLAAKKFGLLVEEFGIGLPPRIWGKKIGETLYSVNWLPFGGFVKIYGEDREDEKKEAAEPSEKNISIEIEEKEIISENKIEIEEKISVSGRVFPGRERSFSALPAWKRAIILFAGVFMNFLLGWLIFSLVLAVGAPKGILIVDVSKNGPAAQAGISAGDRIVDFTEIGTVQSFIDNSGGKEILLKIEHQGEIKDLNLSPRINPPSGEGPLGVVLVQTGFSSIGVGPSIIEGMKASVETLGLIVKTVFNLVRDIFVGKADFSQISGPVGIVKITDQAGGLGMVYVLQLLALISLNLVIMNIIPIPALDGGRLLFLLIEKIKGSPLPLKFERYANAVGMAFLLLLMIVITVKDIKGFF